MTITVLLTNDDGPPNARESPYIFGLYQHLTEQLGWNVKVVIPSSQKSWIGKAYHIQDVIQGMYYYPTKPSGLGELSMVSRPLKPGEVGEWILLDGTPATCANIALHNLYPGQIDLVVSGPNLGRNCSRWVQPDAAFTLSSGTLGAAMSSSLSKTRSIAISYATLTQTTPATYFDPAHVLGTKIINHLWTNWGSDAGGLRNGEVDLYNVNVPLVEGLLTEGGLRIFWTSMWRTSYDRLFDQDQDQTGVEADKPAALSFRWAPRMEGVVKPDASKLPVGSDGWAIDMGAVSVTPLRASYAEPPSAAAEMKAEDIEDKVWKVEL